jgi:hypothetical protein
MEDLLDDGMNPTGLLDEVNYDLPAEPISEEQIRKDISHAKSEWESIYNDCRQSLLATWSDDKADIWTPTSLAARQGKPTTTVPYIRKFVNKVCELLRLQDVQIKAVPRVQGIEKGTIKFVSDYIRNVQDKSGAPSAYRQAFQSAVTCGLGFIYIESQEKIKGVSDPLRCWIDPKSQEIDGSDAEFAFIEGDEETIYYRKSFNEDGSSVCMAARIDKKTNEIDQWQTDIDDLPIIPVYGQMQMIDGKRYVSGIAGGLIEIQRGLNWTRSVAIERIGASPKPTVIYQRGSVDLDEVSKTIADSYPTIGYDGQDEDGQPYAPPQIISPVANLTDTSAMAQSFANDFYEVTGIYPAQLGESKAGESGIAIQLKQFASSNLYMGMLENLKASIKAAGQVLLDDARIMLQQMGAVQVMQDNGEIVVATPPQMVDFDSFDFAVEISKSYQTNKQEKIEKLQGLAQVIPQSLPFVADILARDLEMGEDVAKRLKNQLLASGTINPDLEGTVSVEDINQVMTMAEQKAAQDAQTIQQLVSENKDLQAKLLRNQETELAKTEMSSIKDIQVATIKEEGADRRAILEASVKELLSDEAFKKMVAETLLKQMGTNESNTQKALADTAKIKNEALGDGEAE